jgi:hypothetical protein
MALSGRLRRWVWIAAVAAGGAGFAQSGPPTREASVRARMEVLASDALEGRESATRNEWLAAVYVASELRQAGLEPLGDADSFLQEVSLPPRGENGEERRTWNVLGKLTGRDPVAAREVVLLGAHLDHVGVGSDGPDRIYNGADDNASGVTAVLELADALARGPRTRRSVIVALFGSEETGGQGARYFIDHPPVPLDQLVACLHFEMMGRPDPKLPSDTVWMTGFERTTLGPALAERGARLVADPHVDEDFFRRSDNIRFAHRGVVAQTISSYGLHKDYHTPSDDLARIDFIHMTRAIESLVAPVRWLADSSFRPEWRPGMQPEPRPGRR